MNMYENWNGGGTNGKGTNQVNNNDDDDDNPSTPAATDNYKPLHTNYNKRR